MPEAATICPSSLRTMSVSNRTRKKLAVCVSHGGECLRPFRAMAEGLREGSTGWIFVLPFAEMKHRMRKQCWDWDPNVDAVSSLDAVLLKSVAGPWRPKSSPERHSDSNAHFFWFRN